MNTIQSTVPSGFPDELYLIGCNTTMRDYRGNARASAQTLGFKAYSLMRMAEMELPVPPAFVLGTNYCKDAGAREAATQRGTWSPGIQALEEVTGKRFGDPRLPLLLSVRSGAPVSMPGMMQTLLNIGLCDATLAGMLRETGNPRLVWDTYRRLIATYGEVVSGISPQIFQAECPVGTGSIDERDLDFAELRDLTRRYLAIYERSAGQAFPQDPHEQLARAIEAVLLSWQSPKACEYRRQGSISDAIGTAVTVQAMVFGNAGGQSGSGVGFTRNPSSGEPVLWIDFLFNAQGEDVVSGRRSAHGHDELTEVMPKVWQALGEVSKRLERSFLDMQDFEFTVNDGRLYMLQTRTGKRTPQAAVRIALDLLDEGVINADMARERTGGVELSALVRRHVTSPDGKPIIALAHAASASSGVAVGEIAFDQAGVESRHAAGVSVILVRRDAETDDIAALELASGLLTQRGSRTAHAAVVARQLGKVCLVGCAALGLDVARQTIRFGDTALHEGDVVTLDGNDGAIYAGALQTVVEPFVDLQLRLKRLREPRVDAVKEEVVQ